MLSNSKKCGRQHWNDDALSSFLHRRERITYNSHTFCLLIARTVKKRKKFNLITLSFCLKTGETGAQMKVEKLEHTCSQWISGSFRTGIRNLTSSSSVLSPQGQIPIKWYLHDTYKGKYLRHIRYFLLNHFIYFLSKLFVCQWLSLEHHHLPWSPWVDGCHYIS